MKETLKTISSLFLFTSIVLAVGTLHAGQSSLFAKVKGALSRTFVSQATESAGTNRFAVAIEDVEALCLPITDANSNGEIPNQSSLPPPPVTAYFARPAEEGPSEGEEGGSWREAWNNRLRDYDENGHPLYNDPDIDDGTVVFENVMEDGRRAPSFVQVRRSGDPGMTMLVAMTGETQMGFDPGLYHVTIIDVREQWSTEGQISVLRGRTQRFRFSLNTPLFAKTKGTREAPSTPPPLPDFRDYPQADGQLCDRDRQPMSIKGTLTVQGIDHGHYSTVDVQEGGTFSLSGLRRGTHLLRFTTDHFYAEQVIQIPLKMIVEGRRLMEIPASRDRNIPGFGG